jgi:hypothetical protein
MLLKTILYNFKHRKGFLDFIFLSRPDPIFRLCFGIRLEYLFRVFLPATRAVRGANVIVLKSPNAVRVESVRAREKRGGLTAVEIQRAHAAERGMVEKRDRENKSINEKESIRKTSIYYIYIYIYVERER